MNIVWEDMTLILKKKGKKQNCLQSLFKTEGQIKNN